MKTKFYLLLLINIIGFMSFSGQKMYSLIFASEDKWNVQLLTSDFNAGIHFLQISQEGQVLYVDKIIKQ